MIFVQTFHYWIPDALGQRKFAMPKNNEKLLTKESDVRILNVLRLGCNQCHEGGILFVWTFTTEWKKVPASCTFSILSVLATLGLFWFLNIYFIMWPNFYRCCVIRKKKNNKKLWHFQRIISRDTVESRVLTCVYSMEINFYPKGHSK